MNAQMGFCPESFKVCSPILRGNKRDHVSGLQGLSDINEMITSDGPANDLYWVGEPKN